jgi:putative intracellular protease/amidase
MALRVHQHQILLSRLFARLGMLDLKNLDRSLAGASSQPVPAAAPAPSADGPAHAKSIKIALYKGPGTGGNGPSDLMKELNASNAPTSIAQVTPEEIQAGALTNFDIVIFAGGSASKQGETLGDAGRAKVEEFVGNGGGYIGICAGAYLAACGKSGRLNLINAKTLSPKWQRGKAVLQVELTKTGHGILGGGKTNLEVLYHNGPVVGPAGEAGLPPYEPLAFFRTEVASNGAPKDIMIGAPAIFTAPYKHGKVLCISPHPEQTDGLEYIITNAVNWVAPATCCAQ